MPTLHAFCTDMEIATAMSCNYGGLMKLYCHSPVPNPVIYIYIYIVNLVIIQIHICALETKDQIGLGHSN